MLKKKEALVLGLALFAMFFGAGNLIFPPSLGVKTGINWFPAGIGFLVTSVVLPLLGVLSFAKVGSLDNVANKVSQKFNTIYCTALILTIGPLFAIPRTGSTTFELGIQPIIGSGGGLLPAIISSIIFFGLTYLLTIKENKITDVLGQYLTPIILVILGLVFTRGLLTPLGTPVETNVQNVFAYGFINGYQTMDALASILFGVVIIKSLELKEINDTILQQKYLIIAGIIAAIGLGSIYIFLIYFGAQISGIEASSTVSAALYISETSLGSLGRTIFGICVGAACLTTSVGLTALTAEWFSKLTSMSYKTIALITCLFSGFVAVGGVDMIVVLAVPALVFLYPITIVLILMNIIGVNKVIYFQLGISTTVIIAGFEVIGSTFNITAIQNIIQMIPLGSIGFVWIIPLALSLLVAFLLDTFIHSKKNA